MPMKIGITGASGLLGSALIDGLHTEHDVYATARHKGLQKPGVRWCCFDLLDSVALNAWLIESQVDWVIHCAAWVNVDQCQVQPQQARQLHVQVTSMLATYLNERGGRLLYISTDSVFDGKKSGAYTEVDQVSPLNVYAETKLAGEGPVLAMKARGLVLRTNIIGWSRRGTLTFFEWLLRGLVEKRPLPLFDDVYFSPLHVSGLTQIIGQLLRQSCSGLYHVAGSAALTKYDFGYLVAEEFALSADNISRSDLASSALQAPRPANMALSSAKLRQEWGVTPLSPKESVVCLKQQYDSGWLSAFTGRSCRSGYRFWEDS
jgi:dTDP-4-dehydrorhamnose reductase